MANELSTSFNGTATIYVITRRVSDSLVRDHVAGSWVAWVDGDIANYDLPLSNKGGDLYAVDAHAGLVNNIRYSFTYYKQASGAPAITDLLLDRDSGTWNGTAVTPTPPPTPGTSGTVYCTSEDVESIMSEHGVTAFIDDDLSGGRSTAETQYIADAISRAAAKMNVYLASRYRLSDLSGNVWCRWANAICAALQVSTRRNNPAPQFLVDECQDVIETLKLVKLGQLPLPDQAESFDMTPTVSNFDVQRAAGVTPARVVVPESVGPQPQTGIQRRTVPIRRRSW